MLNSQQRLQQQISQQHQQLLHSVAVSNGNGSTSKLSTTQTGTGAGGGRYFIFDDLTTALQERSDDDQTASSTKTTTSSATTTASSTGSSSSSSVIHQNRQQLQQHYHQQIHHHHHLNHQQQHQQQQQHSFHHPHRQKCCFDEDTTYHFKTLIPAVAAGAIIGKGGETIATVQKESGARVKMSKSHDFYPGTTERVCLISGSVESILTVLDFIMEKIREKPELVIKSEGDNKQSHERDRQVKILVPNSTAGMIIGKSGAYIKQIKEESGSYVQISQKPRDITLQERCITVIGDPDKNKIACRLILEKIVEDPQSGTCLNVSYADVSGPVANFNPTGSPYASNQNSISSSTASLNSTISGHGLLMNGSGINLSLNLNATNPTNPQATAQMLDHIKMSMRGAGYSEPAATEVCQALAVLAKYGVLGNGVGLAAHHPNGTHHPTPIGFLGVSPLDHTISAASGVFGAIGQVNLDSFIGQTSPTPRPSLDPSFDPFRQATAPISLNNNSFGLATGNTSVPTMGPALTAISKSPTPGDVGNKDTKNVEIPEVIVGAILGPSGRNLVEIQNMSGATIQISKKGIFSPGTRNRIVTITGPISAITKAQILIEQTIQMEETKRASQNAITGIMQ